MTAARFAKEHKWLYWTPRAISILFILFLSLFSLDIFGNNYTFWETVVGLFMHNIPSFILTALLIVAWRHEIVGAVTFVSAGLLYIILVMNAVYGGLTWYIALSWCATITLPALAIGGLWFANYRLKNKKK